MNASVCLVKTGVNELTNTLVTLTVLSTPQSCEAGNILP